MKKYFMIAAAVLAAVAFASCNADPEVEGNKGGDEGKTEEPVEFKTTDATTVCINELNGNDGYKGIELYNPTDAEVSLEGWAIVKNGEETLYWEGVEGNKIAAKGYFVIKANKKTAEIDGVASATGTGGLSAAKAVKLELKNANGAVVDTFDRGLRPDLEDPEVALPTAEGSMARKEDGKALWKVMAATFGATNNGANVIGDIVTVPEE